VARETHRHFPGRGMGIRSVSERAVACRRDLLPCIDGAARRLLILCVVVVMAAGCVGVRPRTACMTPPVITGVTNNRTFQASVADSVGGLLTAPGPPRRRLDVLVLSGGGSWGAYGAGFINGWTKRAPDAGIPRPQFDIVTGISTGALIAPFALL